MAGKVVVIWISFILSLCGVKAIGEFSILHSPKSLYFFGNEEVFESTLKEIYSASLGLSVEENSDWDGLAIVDPFNTPKAVVEVYVGGVSSLNIADKKYKNFHLIVDEYSPDMYFALKHRIKQRFTNTGNLLVNMDLSNPDENDSDSDVFGKIPKPKVTKQSLEHLKYSVEEDYQFLSELEFLNALIAKIKSNTFTQDNAIDFYSLKFQSLHALSDFHGPNSLQTKEAKKLLGKALEALTDAFVKAYDGSVLVTVVTTDVAHTRAIRAAPNSADEKQAEEVEASYSEDYPAIFNIILWFGVVIAFAMISIVYAVMDMDPGRDSIIYRMTNTRMKKDN